MNAEAKKRLNEINDDLYDLMDRLDELSEDEADLSKQLNKVLDYLSTASDIIEEML